MPSQLTFPVIVEHIPLFDGVVLMRVWRRDGGMEEVTIEVAELAAGP